MSNPIFFLSTGRCGTLALQRFLKKSDCVEAFHRYRGRGSEFCNDMSFVLEQNYAFYHALRDGDEKVRRQCVRLLRRSRDYLIRRVNERGKGFVEINHEFTPYGPLLMEAFPGAKFVHLFRDPKHVVTSFMQKFNPPPMTLSAYMGTRFSLLGQYVLRYGYFTAMASWGPKFLRDLVASKHFDTQLHPFEKVAGRWREQSQWSPFEKTCWYWDAVNRVALDLMDRLEDDRKLSIKFEDFFAASSLTEKKRFLDFVGADDISEAVIESSFEKKLNVKEVHTDFPSPKSWDDGMKRSLFRLCGETMDRLGYVQR
jgi:hypothetical protein